ncbi:hypothetical protein D9M73_162600 [compost metagenome]
MFRGAQSGVRDRRFGEGGVGGTAVGVEHHGYAHRAELVYGGDGAWHGRDPVDPGLLPLQPVRLVIRGTRMRRIVIFEAEIEQQRLVHVEHHRAGTVSAGKGFGLVERGAGAEHRRSAVTQRLGIGLFARQAAAHGIDQRIVGLPIERGGFARAVEELHGGGDRGGCDGGGRNCCLRHCRAGGHHQSERKQNPPPACGRG